jgi:hypothetical protein
MGAVLLLLFYEFKDNVIFLLLHDKTTAVIPSDAALWITGAYFVSASYLRIFSTPIFLSILIYYIAGISGLSSYRKIKIGWAKKLALR